MTKDRATRVCAITALVFGFATADATEIRVTAQDRSGAPPSAGEAIELTFAIEDSVTGFPVSGLHLRGWLRPKPAEGSDCELAARRFLRSGVSPRREVSLDGINLLTFDRDGTAGLIDPRLDLATANLLAVEKLGSLPGDLQLLENQGLVAASLPAADAIVLLDGADGANLGRVEFARGSAPGDLLELDDTLWAALDGTGQLGVLNLLTLESEARGLELRAGPTSFALDADPLERWLIALDRASGEVTVVDALERSVVARRGGRGEANDLVVSSIAGMAYRLAGIEIEALLLPELQAVRTVSLPFAASDLALSEDGRWLFAYGASATADDRPQRGGKVGVIDVSANRLVHTLSFDQRPDEIRFTDEIAWIRFADRAGTVLVPLRELDDERRIGVAELPTGSRPPGTSALPLLAPLPGHGGMMLAGNPADRVVYALMQGMLAPMSSIAIKTGELAGVVAIDRAPVETGPGRYVAFTRAPGAGELEIVLWLDRLEEAHCLPLRIEDAGRLAERVALPRVELVRSPEDFTAGQASLLRLLVHAPDEELLVEGVTDLSVLLLDPQTGWHTRGRARPQKEGGYAFEVAPPRAGRYRLLVHSPSLGIRYEDTQLMTVEVNR